MKRRRLLQTLCTLAGSGTFAVGSGAFSSTNASRTVSISVVEDDDAYLALIPNDDSGLVRSNASDGTLEFALPGLNNIPSNSDAPTGDGVNSGSIYAFTDLAQVRNQGSIEVNLFSQSESLPSEFETVGLVGPNGHSLDGQVNSITLPVGATESVGLLVEVAEGVAPTEQRRTASFDIVAESTDD